MKTFTQFAVDFGEEADRPSAQLSGKDSLIQIKKEFIVLVVAVKIKKCWYSELVPVEYRSVLPSLAGHAREFPLSR